MINPPSNMTALDGKDATIPCEAEGAPAPNITWYRNGKKKKEALMILLKLSV